MPAFLPGSDVEMRTAVVEVLTATPGQRLKVATLFKKMQPPATYPVPHKVSDFRAMLKRVAPDLLVPTAAVALPTAATAAAATATATTSPAPAPSPALDYTAVAAAAAVQAEKELAQRIESRFGPGETRLRMSTMRKRLLRCHMSDAARALIPLTHQGRLPALIRKVAPHLQVTSKAVELPER